MITCLVYASFADATPIESTSDSDVYIYNQTNTTDRSYMNVGQYYRGYSTHYYVGLANWDGKDLSSLAGKTNVSLSLFVQNFVDPVFGKGIYAQPTSFTYPTTGNFTLKVVALSGTPNPADMTDTWVKTNLVDAAGVGSVTLTNAGYNTVNIGNTVSNWIAAGSGPRWLGFVGSASTTSLYTSVQLGTMEAKYDLDGNLITAAAPMYLSATDSTPPPAPLVQSSRTISSNEMEITFAVVPSVSYVLKTKSNLSDTNWASVYSFVAGSTSTNLTVPMTNSVGRGFYRLEVATP